MIELYCIIICNVLYMQMQLELHKFDISVITVNVEVHRPSVDG
jgi:hypothetical protein